MWRVIAVLATVGCGRVGFEATRDISSDAASDATVDANVDGPSSDAPAARVQSELVALYAFDEGSGTVAEDASSSEMDLTLTSAESFLWTANGLRLLDANASATTLGSTGPITDAIMNSNEFTLEVWAVPAFLAQEGPTRIMALSDDPLASSNAVLLHGDGDGQPPCDPGIETDTAFQLRARSSETAELGCPPLVTPIGTAQLSLLHLVATRASSGVRVFYVDGVQVGTDQVGGDFSGWSLTARLALFNEPTNDRGWLGELQLAAIYSRALTATEVATNFAAGAN